MAKRVFFSFHYKDVAEFRANAVRNHKVVKGGDAEYFDASLWEEMKKKGDVAIKRMINEGVDRTSVTAVLIGSETYGRRWVRYEIMKSIARGNLLLGIHINSVGDKGQQTKSAGPNPFEFLGYRFSNDGRQIELFEAQGDKWAEYRDLDPWSFGEAKPESVRGKFYRVSGLAKIYDWMKDDGFQNFDSWIEA
jgi:hypothetical protein